MIPQSSDVFSAGNAPVGAGRFKLFCFHRCGLALSLSLASAIFLCGCHKKTLAASQAPEPVPAPAAAPVVPASHGPAAQPLPASSQARSEEHTSELQSL